MGGKRFLMMHLTHTGWLESLPLQLPAADLFGPLKGAITPVCGAAAVLQHQRTLLLTLQSESQHAPDWNEKCLALHVVGNDRLTMNLWSKAHLTDVTANLNCSTPLLWLPFFAAWNQIIQDCWMLDPNPVVENHPCQLFYCSFFSFLMICFDSIESDFNSLQKTFFFWEKYTGTVSANESLKFKH